MNLEKFGRYREIFGDEYDEFLEYSARPLKKCVRINTLKIGVEECVERLEKRGLSLERLPWIENGFRVEEKNCLIGHTLEHFLGLVYVQEGASMVPPLVLRPEEGEIVLDLAAAPGSKTTQISEMMKNTGIVVANDVSYKRIKSLRSNAERLGIVNLVVTRLDGRRFGRRYPGVFDRVLLDAPCSSEGSVRKDWGVLNRLSLRLIRRMSRLQKSLLTSALEAVKPGGTVVYSTCTVAPEENEEVVDHAVKSGLAAVEPVKVPGLVTRPGLTEWNGRKFDDSLERCIRIWPQDNDTQAFFVAKLVRI